MKPLELVELIRIQKPASFGNLSDKMAAKLIRLALVQVGKQIEELDEGALRVSGLGTFKVRGGEQDQPGAKATSRRITFRPQGTRAED